MHPHLPFGDHRIAISYLTNCVQQELNAFTWAAHFIRNAGAYTGENFGSALCRHAVLKMALSLASRPSVTLGAGWAFETLTHWTHTAEHPKPKNQTTKHAQNRLGACYLCGHDYD